MVSATDNAPAVESVSEAELVLESSVRSGLKISQIVYTTTIYFLVQFSQTCLVLAGV